MRKKILFFSFAGLFIFAAGFPVYLRAQYKEYYKDVYKQGPQEPAEQKEYKARDYGDVVYSEKDIKDLLTRMKRLEAKIENLESTMEELQQSVTSDLKKILSAIEAVRQEVRVLKARIR